MTRLEYRLAAGVLRVLGALFRLLPHDPRRVVLASPRLPWLDGNLAHIHAAMHALRPDLHYTVLAEPYAYDLRGKIAYLLRLVRAMYHLQTARLVVVDNAYLPIHVAPHRRSTTSSACWRWERHGRTSSSTRRRWPTQPPLSGAPIPSWRAGAWSCTRPPSVAAGRPSAPPSASMQLVSGPPCPPTWSSP